jgi:hypothetical protein
MSEEVKFVLTNGERKYEKNDLKQFELITILGSKELKGEDEPIVIPDTTVEQFDQFMDRAYRGLSVMPNHYIVADFLQYEYTPSLWRPHELRNLKIQASDEAKKRDQLVESICQYIKVNSKIDANSYLTCNFSKEIAKQLSDTMVEKGVRKRLKEVLGGCPTFSRNIMNQGFKGMKVKLK